MTADAQARGVEGCGDNSCIFGPPGGMATNGGCRCLDDLPRNEAGRATRRRITRAILELRRQVRAAEEKAKGEAKEEKICSRCGHEKATWQDLQDRYGLFK